MAKEENMRLFQYKVSWEDKELLLYAKDREDAKRQVGAPPTAKVEDSNLSEWDIKALLRKSLIKGLARS